MVTLECSRCGAPYKGTIPRWVDYVKCEYCGTAIQIRQPDESTPLKEFDLQEFDAFLKRKGIRTFDPASGIMKIGSNQVFIDSRGTVKGSAVLKRKVERWINQHMSEH